MCTEQRVSMDCLQVADRPGRSVLALTRAHLPCTLDCIADLLAILDEGSQLGIADASHARPCPLLHVGLQALQGRRRDIERSAMGPAATRLVPGAHKEPGRGLREEI